MNVPIRLRMTIWYVCLLAAVVAAIGAFLVVRLRADLTGDVDADLVRATHELARGYREEGITELAEIAGTALHGERAATQLLTAGRRVATMFGDEVARRPLLTRAQLDAALSGEVVTVTRRVEQEPVPFRVVALRAAPGGPGEAVVAAESLASVDASVRRVVVLLLVAVPVALAATAAGGWWLARRALRPIARITETAAHIGADRLDERVPEPDTRDEVGRLADTLNTMLDRLENAVVSQQRLVADASHELRTPLAAMRAEIDVSLFADELSAGARTTLLSAREEVDRMSRTVADLLTLAAVDEGMFALVARPTELDGLAASVADALRPWAHRRHVRLELEATPATVLADGEQLSRAVRNMIENAIRYSPEGGTVAIRTGVRVATAVLEVDDDGPGVPDHLRERIFERFFRADPSRTRATGGSGLGLAITRHVAEGHGGKVGVRARRPRGSSFVLELPIADS